MLRRFGIYELPEGTLAVAVPLPDGCHLFPLGDWEKGRRAEGLYIVHKSGLIRREGKLTGWHAKDLTDTGRTLGPGQI